MFKGANDFVDEAFGNPFEYEVGDVPAWTLLNAKVDDDSVGANAFCIDFDVDLDKSERFIKSNEALAILFEVELGDEPGGGRSAGA